MVNPSPTNAEDCPPHSVPRRDYEREMIRYGLLPVDRASSAPAQAVSPTDGTTERACHIGAVLH